MTGTMQAVALRGLVEGGALADGGGEEIGLAAHRREFGRCAVLRVFQVTGVIPALIARRWWGTPFVTTPLVRGNRDTDIPEDFLVTNSTSVTIPPGALYLFVGVPDPFYSDNTDTDNNFAIRVTPSGFAGIRSNQQ